MALDSKVNISCHLPWEVRQWNLIRLLAAVFLVMTASAAIARTGTPADPTITIAGDIDAKHVGSILTLFPDKNNVDDLSANDRAALKSLYRVPLDRNARSHRGRLKQDIVKAKLGNNPTCLTRRKSSPNKLPAQFAQTSDRNPSSRNVFLVRNYRNAADAEAVGIT